jgi:hypothetical protein
MTPWKLPQTRLFQMSPKKQQQFVLIPRVSARAELAGMSEPGARHAGQTANERVRGKKIMPDGSKCKNAFHGQLQSKDSKATISSNVPMMAARVFNKDRMRTKADAKVTQARLSHFRLSQKGNLP